MGQLAVRVERRSPCTTGVEHRSACTEGGAEVNLQHFVVQRSFGCLAICAALRPRPPPPADGIVRRSPRRAHNLARNGGSEQRKAAGGGPSLDAAITSSTSLALWKLVSTPPPKTPHFTGKTGPWPALESEEIPRPSLAGGQECLIRPRRCVQESPITPKHGLFLEGRSLFGGQKAVSSTHHRAMGGLIDE